MTDIIKLAREAGIMIAHRDEMDVVTYGDIERFAELVAKQEREACYEIAAARYKSLKQTENAHYRLSDQPFSPESFGFDLPTCMESKDIADAIRSRAKEPT